MFVSNDMIESLNWRSIESTISYHDTIDDFFCLVLDFGDLYMIQVV